MESDPTEQLAHAVELEVRDDALAEAITAIAALSERVGEIRARVSEIAVALDRLPRELEEAEAARAAALGDEHVAEGSRKFAELRLADLESSRRPRNDDLDQARRELTRAIDDVADTHARLRRRTELERALRDSEIRLRAELAEIAIEAHEVATQMAFTPRVPDAGKQLPGDDLDAWGAVARAALFVARGGLETERERVVTEANELGSAVLGEQLGASSTALVRRRIEEAFEPGV